jgi:hypothetical protein
MCSMAAERKLVDSRGSSCPGPITDLAHGYGPVRLRVIADRLPGSCRGRSCSPAGRLNSDNELRKYTAMVIKRINTSDIVRRSLGWSLRLPSGP